MVSSIEVGLLVYTYNYKERQAVRQVHCEISYGSQDTLIPIGMQIGIYTVQILFIEHCKIMFFFRCFGKSRQAYDSVIVVLWIYIALRLMEKLGYVERCRHRLLYTSSHGLIYFTYILRIVLYKYMYRVISLPYLQYIPRLGTSIFMHIIYSMRECLYVQM